MKEKQVKLPGPDHRFPAVGHIRGHVVFYPERVDEVAEQVPGVRKD